MKSAMNLKENKEEFRGLFGGQKRKGETSKSKRNNAMS